MVKKRFLLMASYCDNDGCNDDLPCDDCLKMCNVVEVPIAVASGGNMQVIGGLDYLRRAKNGATDISKGGNDENY